MKRICLVTGATGFVGLNLIEQLILDTKDEWIVVAVSRQEGRSLSSSSSSSSSQHRTDNSSSNNKNNSNNNSNTLNPIDRYLPNEIASQIHIIKANLENPGELQQALKIKLQELLLLQKQTNDNNNDNNINDDDNDDDDDVDDDDEIKFTTIFHLVHLKEITRLGTIHNKSSTSSSSTSTYTKKLYINPNRIFVAAGFQWEGYDEHLRLNEQAMEEIIHIAHIYNVERVLYCSSWSSYGIQPTGTMLIENDDNNTTNNNINNDHKEIKNNNNNNNNSSSLLTIPLGFFGLFSKPVPYFVSKRNCEKQLQYAIQSGKIRGGIILQPSSIFGKYCQSGWSTWFIRLLQTSGNIDGLPGSSSFCDATQVAKTFLSAATIQEVAKTTTTTRTSSSPLSSSSATSYSVGHGETYIIGGTNATTLKMMQLMAQLVGVKGPSHAKPAWLLLFMSRYNEMILYLLSCILPSNIVSYLLIKPNKIGSPFLMSKLCQSQGTYALKAQSILGYQSLSLETILRTNYNWLVQEGILPTKKNE